MSYFILMGRRIPKQAITGFKFQNETDNIRPFLSIKIRGKDEIIPFKDKKEIQSVKAHHPKTGYCFHCDTDNWIPKND